MMKYLCLAKEQYDIEDHSYVPLREEDIISIKKWRNEQMDILRQNYPLTDQDQILYYQKVILPSFQQKNPKNILFSILNSRKCIGYCGLTNLDWISRKAEISFLIETIHSDDFEVYGKNFFRFLEFIKSIAFDEINFNRIFSETYNNRPHNIEILENCGFKQEGILRENVIIKNKFVDSKIHGFLRREYVSK